MQMQCACRVGLDPTPIQVVALDRHPWAARAAADNALAAKPSSVLRRFSMPFDRGVIRTCRRGIEGVIEAGHKGNRWTGLP